MGLDNSVGFCSYDQEYNALVNGANERLQDKNQHFFDMGYVSRRAVGMRMLKAQEAGHFLNHNNTTEWETIVRLSAAASTNGEEDEEEEAAS